MKTKELYLVAFLSLFFVIFIASIFSSGITGMAVAKSDVSIVGEAYKFTFEQFTSGGMLNKILFIVLVVLIILLIVEIVMLIIKRQKRDKVKKIKYLIDSAEHELENKNFINARNIYMQIREKFEKLIDEDREKIRLECMDLFEKISKKIE